MVFLAAARSNEDFVSFDAAVSVPDSFAVLLQEMHSTELTAKMASVDSSCFIKKLFSGEF
jgi:hypothetical protein